MSSAFLVGRPFGRKFGSERATRNRCCKGIQLIHVHVLVDKKEAQRLDCRRKIFHGSAVFPTLQRRSACSNCRCTRSRHTIIQRHIVIEYNCRARCGVHYDIMQLRKVMSSLPHRMSPNHITAPTRAREEAAVPSGCTCHVTQRTPINTHRVATTRRPWCCVANARSTTRDGTATSSQRASARRPTICGLPSDLGFARWLNLRVWRHIHGGTAGLVTGHKGFATITLGCPTLRRVATVNS